MHWFGIKRGLFFMQTLASCHTTEGGFTPVLKTPSETRQKRLLKTPQQYWSGHVLPNKHCAFLAEVCSFRGHSLRGHKAKLRVRGRRRGEKAHSPSLSTALIPRRQMPVGLLWHVYG